MSQQYMFHEKSPSDLKLRRRLAIVLPHSISGRIATGIFSIPVLLIGAAGCWIMIYARRDDIAQGNFHVSDAIICTIIIEFSLLIAFVAATSLIWAIAAPKWIEHMLLALANKILFWLIATCMFSVVMIVVIIAATFLWRLL